MNTMSRKQELSVLVLLFASATGQSVLGQTDAGPTSRAAISLTDFTKPDDADDAMGFSGAMMASKVGDTVRIPAGTYRFSRPIVFRTGRTYAGEGAVLKFNVPKNLYGVSLEGNASNVTITGLTFDGGGVRLTDGRQYTNITLRNNTFTHMPDTPGIFCTVANEQLIVEENTFRDYAHWGVILWQMNNGSYSHNKFLRIMQGGQLMEPRENVQASFNVGRKLHRMGLEIQQQSMTGLTCKNLTVEGNVFYDWDRPFPESYGLSIMPLNSTKTTIKNNYLGATHEGEWGEKDNMGRSRFGYGIEAGFRTGIVENNIIGGGFWYGVVVASKYAPVRNNKFFGITKDNETGGEPGANGSGIPAVDGNEINPDLSKMPEPPIKLDLEGKN